MQFMEPCVSIEISTTIRRSVKILLNGLNVLSRV
jgi:hypothetical protein